MFTTSVRRILNADRPPMPHGAVFLEDCISMRQSVVRANLVGMLAERGIGMAHATGK